MAFGKIKIIYRFTRLFSYRVLKRKWFLPSTSEITCDELFDRMNSDNSPLLIIDLRPEEEFNGTGESSYMTVYGHIQGAKRIGIMDLSKHLDDLQSFMEEESDFDDLELFKEIETITICPGGGMSLIAVEIMEEKGFTNAKSLRGGMEEWKEKGYPLTTTS